MPGHGGEAEAVEVKVEQVGEFECAQDRRDGQIGAAAVGFGGQVRVVEGGVVGDQAAGRAAAASVGQRIGAGRPSWPG